MMEMILSSIYSISINSFDVITNTEGSFVAEKSYLFIVVIISTVCIGLSLAILVMMGNSGKKQAEKTDDGKKVQNDVESPVVVDDNEMPRKQCGSGGSDDCGGGGGSEVVRVREGRRVADITSLAQEMGFVVLIPDVMQAWKKRDTT